MAAPLTPVQRDEYGQRAYQRSLAGLSAPAIAQELGIGEKTVDSLLRRERQKAARSRAAEGEHDLATFLAEQSYQMARSNADADNPACPFRDRAAHRMNAIAASVNKARALGLFIARADITSGGRPLEEILADILSRPVAIRVPDDMTAFDAAD